MILALALILAYFVGAIPTSLLAAKYGAGVDLRRQGSGNLGATNLYRVLGLKYAVPVGLIDLLKGTFAVLVIAPRAGSAGWVPLVVGSAAILGHVFSVYVRFKGGKGVATAAGVVAGLAPIPFLVSVAAWILVLWASGIMSLASMTAALSFPIASRLLKPEETLLFIASVLIAAFIVVTHRSNIRRLIAGTEPRVARREKGA